MGSDEHKYYPRGLLSPNAHNNTSFAYLFSLANNKKVEYPLKVPLVQWRDRRGQSAPQRLLTGKFLMTYREKRGKEKMEKG